MKNVLSITLMLILAIGINSCKSEAGKEVQKALDSQKAQDITILIGSENAYKPFAYLNEKSEPSGFDNDAARIVASYIPNASLAFVPVSWNAIFQGLESGKFNVIANQITKNSDREKKYLFSNKPYFYGTSALIVGAESSAKDFNDLKGAKIGVTVGSNHAINLEKFIASNKHLKIQIVFYKTSPTLVADLANKKIAAIINDPIASNDYAKAQKIAIRPTSVYLEKTPVYFMFDKDNNALKALFDEALDKALADGKLRDLSMQYFGEDFTQ